MSIRTSVKIMAGPSNVNPVINNGTSYVRAFVLGDVACTSTFIFSAKNIVISPKMTTEP